MSELNDTSEPDIDMQPEPPIVITDEIRQMAKQMLEGLMAPDESD